MTHSNILKHPVFYAIPVLLIAVMYMFFAKSSFATGDVFGVSKVQKKFDNVKTKGMEVSAKPVQQNYSSQKEKQVTVTPVIGVPLPVPVPDYATYKIDGYINDNGKYIISISGHSVRLPSPYVKSWSKESHEAVAKISVFGSSYLGNIKSSSMPVYSNYTTSLPAS